MKPSRYHSAAYDELLEAVAFYEIQQSRLVRTFLRAVMTAIESVQFDPTARQIMVPLTLCRVRYNNSQDRL